MHGVRCDGERVDRVQKQWGRLRTCARWTRWRKACAEDSSGGTTTVFHFTPQNVIQDVYMFGGRCLWRGRRRTRAPHSSKAVLTRHSISVFKKWLSIGVSQTFLLSTLVPLDPENISVRCATVFAVIGGTSCSVPLKPEISVWLPPQNPSRHTDSRHAETWTRASAAKAVEEKGKEDPRPMLSGQFFWTLVV